MTLEKSLREANKESNAKAIELLMNLDAIIQERDNSPYKEGSKITMLEYNTIKEKYTVHELYTEEEMRSRGYEFGNHIDDFEWIKSTTIDETSLQKELESIESLRK